MRDRKDVERRLRDALRAEATRVTPDPETWVRVRDRINARRGRRFALAGALAVTAVAVVGVLLPNLPALRVEFAPEPPGQPDPADQPGELPTTETAATEPQLLTAPTEQAATPVPLPTPVPEPPPDPVVVQEPIDPPGVAAVASLDGALVAFGVEGSQTVLTPGGQGQEDVNPAFSPDGTRLAFERRPSDSSSPSVIETDLATGQETFLAEGGSPAISGSGLLAFVSPGDQPQIVVRGADGDPVASFPAAAGDAADGALQARHLSFSRNSGRLYWETAGDSSNVWFAELDSEQPQPQRLVPPDDAEGVTFAAPAVTDDSVLTVIRRCCDEAGGSYALASLDESAIVAAGSVTFAEIAELPASFDPQEGAFAAPAGSLAPDAALASAWSARETRTWLVSDGTRVFTVAEGGEVIQLEGQDELGDAVSSIAVNPVADVEPAAASIVAVDVFFTGGDGSDCSAVEGVERSVQGPGVLRGALEELLTGPTEQEAMRGLSSFFSADTDGLLNDVTLDAATGTARVDFPAGLAAHLGNASTSCGSEALLAQLDATAMQFETVTSVRYSFDGSEDSFYAFLQRTTPPE